MHSPNLLPAIAIVISVLAAMIATAAYVLTPRKAPKGATVRRRPTIDPATVATSPARADLPGFCQMCWRPVSDVGVLLPTTYLHHGETIRLEVCEHCRSVGEIHVVPVLHVDVSDMEIPAALPARPKVVA